MKRAVMMSLVFCSGLVACQKPRTVTTEGKPGQVAEGGQTGNGGFAFLRSSSALLDEAQKRVQELLVKNHSELDKRLSAMTPSIDVVEMSELVIGMKKDRNEGVSETAINPDGISEPKVLSLVGSGDKAQIVVQPQFFQSYAGEALTEANLQEVMRAIVHESLHAFGYDEKKAYGASLYILQNLLGVDQQSLYVERRESGFFGGKMSRCGNATQPSCEELKAGLLKDPESAIIVFEMKKDDDLSTYSLLYRAKGEWNLRLESGGVHKLDCRTEDALLVCETALDGETSLNISIDTKGQFLNLRKEKKDMLPGARPLEWIPSAYSLYSI